MFLKNFFSFSVANVYAQVMRMTQEFVVRRILSPEVMGVWSFILVLQNFGTTFDLGVTTAATRELPLLYGADKLLQARQCKYTVFWLHFAAKIIIGFGLILYTAYCYISSNDIMVLLAGCAAGLMVACYSIGESLIIFYQSVQQYIKLSKLLIIYWTLYAMLLIIGAYVGQVVGLVVASVVAFLLQGVLLKQGLVLGSEGIRSRRWDWSMAKSLLSFALPFRVVDYPMSLALVLDGMFVTKFLGLKVLAIYMTAKVIFNQAGQIPTWLGNVFIIRLTTLYGSGTKSKAEMGEEMFRILQAIYLVILPLIICSATFVSCFMVANYLPKYILTLNFLPILLLTLYFIPRVTVIRNFWIIEEQFGYLALSNILGISVMCVGFSMLWMMSRITMVHVAEVFFLAFFVYFLFISITLGLDLWGIKKLMIFMFYLFLSFFVVSCAVYMSLYQGNTIVDFTSFSLMKWMRIGFYMLLMISPLMLLGGWRTGMFSLIKQRLQQ